MGFVINKLSGSSWAFLAAGGTVVEKQLEEGESILVDQNSVVAFEDSVKFSVAFVGGAGIICVRRICVSFDSLLVRFVSSFRWGYRLCSELRPLGVTRPKFIYVLAHF
jgi:hypothetical protein